MTATASQLEVAVRAHGQSGRDAEKGQRLGTEVTAVSALGHEIKEDSSRDVHFRCGKTEVTGA